MTTDVIERRRAVEERLRRARTLATSLEEAAANLAEIAGQPIDQLDPGSCLRTALTALAGVAALRPEFDVIVTLPGSAFALRVRHVEDDVDIEVLQRDGPAPEPAAEPVPPPVPVPTAAPDAVAGDHPAHPDDQAHPDDSAQSASPDPATADVASDLAAMLWQNVGDQPS